MPCSVARALGSTLIIPVAGGNICGLLAEGFGALL